MKKREIIIVANRIAGIYLLILVIGMLPNIGTAFDFLKEGSRYNGLSTIGFFIGNVMTFLLFIAGALCLIRWSDRIATKLCAKDEMDDTGGSIGKDDIQEIAFSIVGIVIIANALPSVIQIIVNLSAQGHYSERVPVGTIGNIIGSLVKLAMGIFLIIGSKRLVGLLNQIQTKSSSISQKPNE